MSLLSLKESHRLLRGMLQAFERLPRFDLDAQQRLILQIRPLRLYAEQLKLELAQRAIAEGARDESTIRAALARISDQDPARLLSQDAVDTLSARLTPIADLFEHTAGSTLPPRARKTAARTAPSQVPMPLAAAHAATVATAGANRSPDVFAQATGDGLPKQASAASLQKTPAGLEHSEARSVPPATDAELAAYRTGKIGLSKLAKKSNRSRRDMRQALVDAGVPIVSTRGKGQKIDQLLPGETLRRLLEPQTFADIAASVGGTAAAIYQRARKRFGLQERKRRATAPEKAQRAVAYIQENPTADLSLETLCELVGLSQTNLSAAFRKATGMTVLSYVTRRRIELAKELLSTTDLHIEAVAHSSGFGGRRSLHVEFQRLVGSTPGAWRKANRVPAEPR